MALAEMGRQAEAAELQSVVEAVFDGREWWVHSDLPRWSDGVRVGLSGGKAEGLPLLGANRRADDRVGLLELRPFRTGGYGRERGRGLR